LVYLQELYGDAGQENTKLSNYFLQKLRKRNKNI